MAVARRSDSSLAFGTRTNSTITAPSGITNGDILLAVLSVGDGTALPALSVSGPAGWNELTGSPVATDRSDPYTISLRAYWKLASGESGNYTFTHSSAATEGYMVALTGADTTTPISPNMQTDTDDNPGTANGTTTNFPSITTPRDGSYLLGAEALWDDTTGMSVPTGTTPTFTQRRAGSVFYVFDGVLTTAGATGAKSHTNGNNSTAVPWVSVFICVQAAAASAGAGVPIKPRMRFWRR